MQFDMETLIEALTHELGYRPMESGVRRLLTALKLECPAPQEPSLGADGQ